MRVAGAVVAALFSLGGTAGAQESPDGARALDVLHYDVSLALPDTGRAIGASVELTIVRRSPTGELVLDLVGMRVTGVAVAAKGDPNRRVAAFSRTDSTLAIRLPTQAASMVDTLVVRVEYGGVPSDGLVISTDSTGRWSAFADNWPRRARFWLPSIDRPDDKATVTWQVRAPKGMTVIANGLPLGTTARPHLADDGTAADTSRRWTTWLEMHPIPTYLMVVAAAPLSPLDFGTCGGSAGLESICIPQAVFVAPEVRDFLPGPFARAPEMVSYFTGLVGPFPYEKLFHVQSSTQFGGMENASAIFYADQPFRDRTMQDGVIAHETAHQWFGDAVTERTFADLWLSEGFATYFAALWAGHAHGDSAFRAEMRANRAAVLASATSRTRPVRDTAQTNYMQLLNTNSYQKGGWILHMLRGEVGDSAFFRGLRAYYAAHRDGNATSADLRAAMETAAGRDLGWFFDQWLTRAGTPAFTLRRVGQASAGLQGYEVRQTSAQPYAFPLTVAERGSGRRATVRVLARSSTRVTLPAGTLDVDPDVALLAAPPTIEGNAQ